MKIPRQLRKTLLFSLFTYSVCVYGIYRIQSTANHSVQSCSYLDPIAIDIIAFAAGGFLFVEAILDILNHKESFLRSQMARCFRMSFGACIVTIHFMQFLHK